MYLLLIFLPLFSFLTLLLFGRFLGHRGALFISLLPVFVSFFISFFIFYEVTFSGATCSIILPLDWITVDVLVIEWHFLFDSLSASMLLVVFFVSSLVHLYSFEYMSEDPHLSRFVSYLSFFTFFMAILLTSGNFIQMFLGWEGVGLSSYLLINFWFTRAQANKSALKAMVINRVGDWGLAFGIFLIFFFFGSVDFYTVFCIAPYLLLEKINFLGLELFLADVITFFLFFGVVGKSAQFGLHTWLPDAMEGPTPVSALIHAATMVTAGVFLTIRCSYLFEYASFTLVLVSFIGALTAFFASTAACFQTDLKKIIAYSTCSQLGYMIAACGLSLYSTALFHFFNHAFFKALLFLSAGSVIHALAGEQDIYNMGSLDVYLPLTSQMFLTGSIALASFPFFAGFYSKDWILDVADSVFYFDNLIMTFFISQAAIFTMLYSDSLVRFVFDGDENFSVAYLKDVGESGFKIVICLLLLAIPAMFSGFLFKDLFIGFGSFTFSDSIYNLPENITFLEADYLPVYWKLMPVFTSFFLLFLIVFGFDFMGFLNPFYTFMRPMYIFLAGYIQLISDFFAASWWYDPFLNYLTITYYLSYCREVTFKLIDKGLLEYIGPYGLVAFFSAITVRVSSLTSGYVYHYAFLLVFGLGASVILSFFFMDSLSFEFLVFELSLFSFFLTSYRR